MQKRLVTVSKFLSKYLRHEPAALGLTLEPGGWVCIEDVLRGAAAMGFRLTRDELDQAVAGNDKRRFTVDESGHKMRANQGHSAPVDLQIPPALPPDMLFHGTVDKFLEPILAAGLNKMNRHDVHLSADRETAAKVGARRGQPVILAINAKQMAADGYTFRLSANGVWLTDHVPPSYLQVV